MEITRRAVFAAGAAAAAASALPPLAGPARAATNGAGAPGYYRIKVGDFEVTKLHDGVTQSPLPENFVRNVPDEEFREALAELFMPDDQWTNTFTPLLVNTGSRLVLIDTGFADNGPPVAGRLRANMEAAGIDPAAIDTVIISHFHPDHILGLRSKDGDALYPNAEVMVPEPEWAFWMDDARMSAAPERMQGLFRMVRRAFEPMADNVKRYAWGDELLSGITAVDAHGHTPGHSAINIASGNDQLLFLADTTNNPLLFARNPEWRLMYDMDADAAIATRKRLLDMAAADRVQVSLYHAVFPANGFITRRGAGYDFVPAYWGASL